MHTTKKYLIKFRLIKVSLCITTKACWEVTRSSFYNNKEWKFKILTSLGCRNDVSGLCCHNGAEKQNIYFFSCQNFVFESYYGIELKKLISLPFLGVCFGFLGLLSCEAEWVLQNCRFLGDVRVNIGKKM